MIFCLSTWEENATWANLKDKFQFRDLRAKAATDKDDKVGIEAAQALLGHRTSSMTADYIRHRMGKLVSPTVSEIERNID